MHHSTPEPSFIRNSLLIDIDYSSLSLTSKEHQQIRDLMGYIIVISLPVILLFLIVAIGCYLFGRNRGRNEATTPQYYGPPAPPYGVQPEATPHNK